MIILIVVKISNILRSVFQKQKNSGRSQVYLID